MKKTFVLALLVIMIGLLLSCSNDEGPTTGDEGFFSEYSSRNFEMGFSTWAYAPTVASVDDTYDFISSNADVYSEHLDLSVPWDAWMNDKSLPAEFTNEITSRKNRKLPNAKLALSVSLLNNSRNELATDYDGSTPTYTALNDQAIEDAYFKHLVHISNELNPDYLIVAIEGNELLIHDPNKWEQYKLLMTNVRSRIKAEFPNLPISESITLHNLYNPTVDNPDDYIEEVVTYANSLDFAAISFYPFFKGLNDKEGFQDAFDFLHEKITKPIAFAETSHLSEDLTVESFDLFIPGNETEQQDYLETLLTNAQEENYMYVIWWAHRDYDELWETFPEEVKDLGKLWISTGIVNEDGKEKEALDSWETAFYVNN